MKKVKWILTGAFLLAFLQLGMQKGNEMILQLEKIAQGKMLSGDEYPAELLELLDENPETEAFVKDYPNRERWDKEVELTKKEIESDAPLFLQWDRRWGYAFYGNKMLALNGCGPTCLSMVLVGLKKDVDMNPKAVAAFSEKKGYITEDSGTQWSLMTEGAKELGLEACELSLTKNKVNAALETGHQIICSMRPGDFTTTGHFIVIYGKKDDKLLIHDPNSKERSERAWSYEEIEGQIKNLWEYK